MINGLFIVREQPSTTKRLNERTITLCSSYDVGFNLLRSAARNNKNLILLNCVAKSCPRLRAR